MDLTSKTAESSGKVLSSIGFPKRMTRIKDSDLVARRGLSRLYMEEGNFRVVGRLGMSKEGDI